MTTDAQPTGIEFAALTEPDVIEQRGYIYNPEDRIITNRGGNIARVKELSHTAASEKAGLVAQTIDDLFAGVSDLLRLGVVDEEVQAFHTWLIGKM